MPYEELVDVPCKFNPKNHELQKIFADDIARAVWVGYRAHHICSDRMMISLADGSLKISEAIKKDQDILNKNNYELGMWIGKHICEKSELARVTFLKDEEDLPAFAEFIRPYLRRKKIATIKLVPADYKDES